jgi:hypothetical protein
MTVARNPLRNSMRWTPPPTEPLDFHRQLPSCRVTPLRDLPKLASEMGVGPLLVKDESNRLGLPAFKVLGASWAIYGTACLSSVRACTGTGVPWGFPDALSSNDTAARRAFCSDSSRRTRGGLVSRSGSPGWADERSPRRDRRRGLQDGRTGL